MASFGYENSSSLSVGDDAKLLTVKKIMKRVRLELEQVLEYKGIYTIIN